VLRLEREIPGDGVPLAEVQDQMARFARLGQERLEMDRLALELISGVSVTIFDDALNDSWRMARRNRSGEAVTTGAER